MAAVRRRRFFHGRRVAEDVAVARRLLVHHLVALVALAAVPALAALVLRRPGRWRCSWRIRRVVVPGQVHHLLWRWRWRLRWRWRWRWRWRCVVRPRQFWFGGAGAGAHRRRRRGGAAGAGAEGSSSAAAPRGAPRPPAAGARGRRSVVAAGRVVIGYFAQGALHLLPLRVRACTSQREPPAQSCVSGLIPRAASTRPSQQSIGAARGARFQIPAGSLREKGS